MQGQVPEQHGQSLFENTLLNLLGSAQCIDANCPGKGPAYIIARGGKGMDGPTQKQAFFRAELILKRFMRGVFCKVTGKSTRPTRSSITNPVFEHN
jgi:hypothetical protein